MELQKLGINRKYVNGKNRLKIEARPKLKKNYCDPQQGEI